MSVIDFSTALKDIIQAGQTVVEGNVVKVIADNGNEIGNAVVNTVVGGNGVGATVYSMTGAVQGGTATTTGVAYLALDLGTFGATIAPCLGIIAGVGLYNIAPNFWDTVGNALYDAGSTIGGKVIAYFDGDNIYFDSNTIETFKNTLIDMDAFQMGEKSNDEIGLTEVTQPIPIASRAVLSTHLLNHGVDYYYNDQWWADNGVATMWRATNTKYSVIVASSDPNSLKHTYSEVSDGTSSETTTNLSDSYTYDDKTVYFAYSDFTTPFDLIAYNPQLNATGTLSQSVWGKIAWVMVYGMGNEPNPLLQEDAIFPNDDEFPLTYPDWYPLNYPDGAPSDLPEIYPAKYPETDPDPYPQQKPAQNPDPEEVPETYPKIIPDLPLPQPNPDPYPEPDPDPQPDPDPTPDPYSPPNLDPYSPPTPDPTPQPDDPTPTPTPDDPTPNPDDPVNPNPDPPTPTPIVPPVLPDTVSSSKLFTVYNPTSAQLDALGAYLWDSSLMETIKKIWMNPLDGIISLIQVYATPTVGGAHNIILGYLDSGVSASVVSSQFVTVDCGSIDVKETKKNATDYAPYVSAHLYLPFIGIVEINVNDVMNGKIGVKYRIDVYTGTCLAEVSGKRTKDMPSDTVLYTFSGNCSQQIPLTSGNATGMLSALVAGAGAGLSIATGGGLGVVAGISMVGRSLTHEMFHVSKSGNLSANAGIMGAKKPYLILSRRQGYDANGYNELYGYPANKTVYLGNYSGFVRVKHCLLKTKATDPERAEIMALLRDGVIF